MTGRRGKARRRRQRVRRWLSHAGRTTPVESFPCGHLRTPENTAPYGKGVCRTCRRISYGVWSGTNRADLTKTPFALVTWKPQSLAMAPPLYFASQEAAESAAPEDDPWTVIDVTREASQVEVLDDRTVLRLRRVLQPEDERALAARDAEILALANKGLRPRDIGRQLGMSPRRVIGVTGRLRRQAATTTPADPQ